MTGFTKKFAERVADATVRVERSDLGEKHRSRTPPIGKHEDERWAELNEDLENFGTAEAHFLIWDVGTQTFIDDVGAIHTVRPELPIASKIPVGTWVKVRRQSGEWWVIRRGHELSEPGCIDTIEGVSISEFTGFDATATRQVLTHAGGGCLTWVSTEECS